VNNIVGKMLELIHVIETTKLDDPIQHEWGAWWSQHLRLAVEKARLSGWVQEGGNR